MAKETERLVAIHVALGWLEHMKDEEVIRELKKRVRKEPLRVSRRFQAFGSDSGETTVQPSLGVDELTREFVTLNLAKARARFPNSW